MLPRCRLRIARRKSASVVTPTDGKKTRRKKPSAPAKHSLSTNQERRRQTSFREMQTIARANVLRQCTSESRQDLRIPPLDISIDPNQRSLPPNPNADRLAA